MLAILFPHMFEDVEYLLPDGAAGLDAHAMDIDGLRGDVDLMESSATLPIAGPSRLQLDS